MAASTTLHPGGDASPLAPRLRTEHQQGAAPSGVEAQALWSSAIKELIV